jgi:hypothetical protein
MSDSVTFSCTVNNSNPEVPLALEVTLNEQVKYKNSHVTGLSKISFDIPDSEIEQCLAFTMSGKQQHHTKIDQEGNILSDALLEIRSITVDGIELDTFLPGRMQYHHDFNGTKPPVEEIFYSDMGCNGTVKWEFTTPFYLWILEHI